jgi:small subunit ribosomal protein S1
VFIVQPESQEGQIILSLDRARGERGWRVLQDYLEANQSFEGYVTGSNKGGLLVNVEGVNAFVPLSQIVAGPERGSPEATQRALTEWVGKNITLKVIELNRRRNRAILSERAAVQEKRAADKERLLQELQEGDVKTGRVTSIRDFGIFVDIGGADGLVHLSELSWERTPKSPHELFKVGDEVPVYVLKVDNETKKIALSVRRAQPERWEEIVSRYREGQVVPGQITKLAPFGAFVRLEGPIEGLIHISELVDRRINHPKEVVQENDVVPVKIVRIEYDRHRLGLSLRQARASAEDDGWTFDEFGGPKDIPQDALDKLGLAAAPQRAATVAPAYAEPEAEAPAEPKPAPTEPPEEMTEMAAAMQAAEEVAAVAEPVASGSAPAETAEAAAAEAPAAEEPVEAEAAEEEAAGAVAPEPETAAAEAVEAPAEEAPPAVEELPASETEAEPVEPEVVAAEEADALESAQEPAAGEAVVDAEDVEEAEKGVTEDPPEALNKKDEE